MKDKDQVPVIQLRIEDYWDNYQAAFCTAIGFNDRIAAESEYEDMEEKALAAIVEGNKFTKGQIVASRGPR